MWSEKYFLISDIWSRKNSSANDWSTTSVGWILDIFIMCSDHFHKCSKANVRLRRRWVLEHYITSSIILPKVVLYTISASGRYSMLPLECNLSALSPRSGNCRFRYRLLHGLEAHDSGKIAKIALLCKMQYLPRFIATWPRGKQSTLLTTADIHCWWQANVLQNKRN